MSNLTSNIKYYHTRSQDVTHAPVIGKIRNPDLACDGQVVTHNQKRNVIMSKSVKTLAIASAVAAVAGTATITHAGTKENVSCHWRVETIMPRVLHNMRRFIHS